MSRNFLNLPGLAAIAAAVIALHPLFAAAALRTWNGSGTGAFWTAATNWVGNVAPVAGDDLLFPPGASQTAFNDFPAGTAFNSLIFSGGNYMLDGNSIALNAGILATNGINNRIYNPLILNSNQTFRFTASSANFNLPATIDTNGKDLTFDAASGVMVQIQAVISGAGGLIRTGVGSTLLYASNTFAGPVQLLEGTMSIYNGNALGDTNGNTTIAAGAYLNLANAITVREPVVLSGTLAAVGAGTKTLTGPITLAGSNVTLHSAISSPATLTINGLISGSNGFVQTGSSPVILNANNTYTGGTTNNSAADLRVNGFQPQNPIRLLAGTLSGTGTVGTVTATGAFAKWVAPGLTNGILNTSNVIFDTFTHFAVDLNGAAPGSGYDQLNVSGTVTLSNATLDLALGFAPAFNQTFIIINNDGADPVNGTFAGRAEGAFLTNGASVFQISYTGGSGNDVTLTTTIGATASTLTSITNLPNAFKQLTGQGVSNLTYTVQAATNLAAPITWTNLGSAAANGSGVFQFTDTNAPTFPTRFYRAVSP